MKLPEINSYSLEKSFEVKSGALRVTDPCYDMETWCAGTLESVKNGKWFAQLGYNIDEHAPDKSPCKMPKYAGIDSELAWWNGEIEGEEPN